MIDEPEEDERVFDGTEDWFDEEDDNEEEDEFDE